MVHRNKPADQIALDFNCFFSQWNPSTMVGSCAITPSNLQYFAAMVLQEISILYFLSRMLINTILGSVEYVLKLLIMASRLWSLLSIGKNK